jgi:hypothetical protein
MRKRVLLLFSAVAFLIALILLGAILLKILATMWIALPIGFFCVAILMLVGYRYNTLPD